MENLGLLESYYKRPLRVHSTLSLLGQARGKVSDIHKAIWEFKVHVRKTIDVLNRWTCSFQILL